MALLKPTLQIRDSSSFAGMQTSRFRMLGAQNERVVLPDLLNQGLRYAI